MLIGIDASRAFVDEPTGTENYSYQLITHILRLPEAKKHNFVLFTRTGAKIPNEIERYTNVIVNQIKFKYLWTQLGLAWNTYQKYDFGVHGGGILEKVWVPAHTLPILGNPKVEMVVTIHGLEYLWLKEYSNPLQRWYLPLSTIYAAIASKRLICVSNSTKNDLIKEIEHRHLLSYFDIQKIIVILEGVEGVKHALTTNEAKILLKTYEKMGIIQQKYVLFVGTIQPRKNIGSLIRAFARFEQTHPGHKLVLAGGIGWNAEEDLKLIGELGIEDKVVWTGRVSALVLRMLYLGAKVYVQPSWTEGFGLPVLEAMQNKVPVVVSSGGALPEVVGTAGVVVEINGSESFEVRLARAIGQLVDEPKLCQKLVQLGQKRVRQLSWEKAAKDTLKTLLI